MGETPKYKWPYPEGGDKPQGHIQMKALATAIEGTVSGADIVGRIEAVEKSLKTRTLGRYSANAAGPQIPAASWGKGVLNVANRDPHNWFYAAGKRIRVPKGVYALGGTFVVHCPANARHHIALAYHITRTDGVGYDSLGQTEFDITASMDVGVDMKTAILWANQTVDIYPGAWGYTVQTGDCLWTGLRIDVMCLVDSEALGLIKEIPHTRPMPPNPKQETPTDFGYSHAEPIQP